MFYKALRAAVGPTIKSSSLMESPPERIIAARNDARTRLERNAALAFSEGRMAIAVLSNMRSSSILEERADIWCASRQRVVTCVVPNGWS
jgi:hypothetical protein